MTWTNGGVRAGVVSLAISAASISAGSEGPGTPADAPAREFGIVSGIVLADTAGTPLGGALVTVLEHRQSGVTRASGGFYLEIPAGTYGVRFAAPGYYPLVVEGVEVEDGMTTSLTAVMITKSR